MAEGQLIRQGKKAIVQPIKTILRQVPARDMYANDVPVQIAVTYLPLDVATSTGLTDVDSGPGGLISRLSQTANRQVSVTETIQVRVPTEREQQVLNLPGDARVYELTHTARTAQGRCVEVTVHVMPVRLWDLDRRGRAPMPPRRTACSTTRSTTNGWGSSASPGTKAGRVAVVRVKNPTTGSRPAAASADTASDLGTA
jgi:UTRA domain